MKIKSGNGFWKNVALGILVICALFTSFVTYRFYEFYTKSNRFKYVDSINCIIDMRYDRVYKPYGQKSYKLIVNHGKEVEDLTRFYLKDIWNYKP